METVQGVTNIFLWPPAPVEALRICAYRSVRGGILEQVRWGLTQANKGDAFLYGSSGKIV